MTLLLNLKKKKKKFIWQDFFRKRYPYLIGIVVVSMLFILLSPYIFHAWVNYPEELRAEMAWRKFTNSFDGNCRESCLASRQSYASIWRPLYKKHPDWQEEKLQLVFNGDNSELQSAMIKIMAADYGSNNLPPYFAELLMSPQVSEENKRLMVVFFPGAFHNESWLKIVRMRVSAKDLSDADRAYALSLLAPYPDLDNINLIKNIILGSDNRIILDAAFKVSSTWSKEVLAWQEAELDRLKESIMIAKTKELRWRRIWLLSEVNNDALKRKERLEAIASFSALDNISRGLAAESLRLEFSLNINTPEPSSLEWQELYDYL